ncbi:MAG: DUF1236 domain-containing protein [Reyranella sp.]|nr:DUF1236 domain-containing protein [Reyranella sp.]
MRTVTTSLIVLLCAALASPASADNDKNKGHGGGSKSEKSDNDRGRGNAGPGHEQRAAPGTIVVGPTQQIVVIDRDRDTVRTFYRTEYAAGRCPPGLAKKHNGCMPPGQAKKAWVIGQPLPPEVVYYPIERELWTQLTPPPQGYEYVRVNDDIVLMSTTTRMIGALLGNLANFGG